MPVPLDPMTPNPYDPYTNYCPGLTSLLFLTFRFRRWTMPWHRHICAHSSVEYWVSIFGSGERTWQLKSPIFNRRYIFTRSMFCCPVSLREGIFFCVFCCLLKMTGGGKFMEIIYIFGEKHPERCYFLAYRYLNVWFFVQKI